MNSKTDKDSLVHNLRDQALTFYAVCHDLISCLEPVNSDQKLKINFALANLEYMLQELQTQEGDICPKELQEAQREVLAQMPATEMGEA